MEAGKTGQEKMLFELCREQKDARHMTYAEIAEKSGIVEKTVKNFFAGAKQPSINTAGPICRACGVSIDKFFNIVTNDHPAALELAQQEIEHLNARMADKEKEIKRKNNLIFIGAVVLIFLIAYMFATDLINPTIGMFRGDVTPAGVIALAGLAALAVAVIYFVSQEFEIRFKRKK